MYGHAKLWWSLMQIRKKTTKWIMSQRFLHFMSNAFVAISLFSAYFGYVFNRAGYLLALLFLFLAASISEKNTENFFRSVFRIFLIIAILAVFKAWFDGTHLIGFEMTDARMLVLVTLGYVLMTYVLVLNQKDLFEKARLPILSFRLEDNFDLCLENIGNYTAREPKVRIRLNYPPLRSISPIKIIRWFIDRNTKSIVLNYPDIFPVNHEDHVRHRDIRQILREHLGLFPDSYSTIIEFDMWLECNYWTDQLEKHQTMHQRMPVKIKLTGEHIELLY